MSAGNGRNIRWGMVIDLDRCTGCGACVAVCQAENNVAPVPDASDKTRSITWLRLRALDNGKTFPANEGAFLPLPCQHCENPPCVPVCPVTATQKQQAGGVVSQTHARCIGCRYCMIACPYHARYFNWQDPAWPKGAEEALSPFVSVRPRGVVEKCTFCSELLAVGEMPLCVRASNGAIAFGDLSDPNSDVRKLLAGNFTLRRKPTLGTEPSVYYII